MLQAASEWEDRYNKLYKVMGLLTTQYQLCVCGDISWWRGQALKREHSYSNLPCTNTDEAQQFSTRWGYGSVAGVGESESGSSSVEVSTSCLVKMEQMIMQSAITLVSSLHRLTGCCTVL